MRHVFLLSFAFILFSACNMFSLVEPDSQHLDKCRALADSNDIDAAIEECNQADPAKTDGVVQTELGDLYLRKAGVTLENLSNIFFQKDKGTDIIRALAESILKIHGKVTAEDKTSAASAVTAFSLSGNDFYSTLARLSHIAVLIAYTDNDSRGTGEADGIISKADICSAASCSTLCIELPDNSVCGGMIYEDAAVVYSELIKISTFIASLTNNKDSLAGKMSAVDSLLNKPVPDPANPGSTIPFKQYSGANDGDVARLVIYQMAK
jgi:hypothetical protein